MDATLHDAIAALLDDPIEVNALTAHVDEVADRLTVHLGKVGPTEGLAAAYRAEVLASLYRKRILLDSGVPLRVNADDISRRTIDFEAFRAQSYVASGVFPKRYFGYLDEVGDTAAEEKRIHRAIDVLVPVCNAWLAEHGKDWRITEQEVAITFLAEDGALLLKQAPARVDGLHPVMDVGLDDVATGFDRTPGLSADIDKALGTDLGHLVVWLNAGDPMPASPFPSDLVWLKGGKDDGPWPFLVRGMSLEEAVAGTALMWVYEKDLADSFAKERSGSGIAGRSAAEQFVIGSLVYNSGRVHSPETWAAIQSFSTADSLFATSERNAATRPRLPVLLPVDSLARLNAGSSYPDQPTSWVAVYHVLQRYGGYAGVSQFSDVFDADGHYRPG